MNYFQFQNSVQIIYGDNSLQELGKKLWNLGGKNALLISDKTLQSIGIVGEIKKNLVNGGIKVGAVYIDIVSRSTVENINELYQIYRANVCDCIVAVGGGSVIDSAKALKLLLTSQIKSLLECRGIDYAKSSKSVPFCVVSTNAGTSRDVCKQTCVYDSERDINMEFETSVMQPAFAVFSPSITATVGKLNSIMGFLDIYAQSVESFCGMQKNIVSDNFAKQALSLMIENYPKVLDKLDDINARDKIQRAQAMASVAFSNSKSGIMYALAHAIGLQCNVEYSKVLSCVIVECLKYNKKACNDIYSQLYFYVAGADSYVSLSAEQRSEKFIEKTSEFVEQFHKYGMPKYLCELGVKEEDISELSQRAFSDSSIVTNARSVNLEDVRTIISNCLKEVQK